MRVRPQKNCILFWTYVFLFLLCHTMVVFFDWYKTWIWLITSLLATSSFFLYYVESWNEVSGNKFLHWNGQGQCGYGRVWKACIRYALLLVITQKPPSDTEGGEGRKKICCQTYFGIGDGCIKFEFFYLVNLFDLTGGISCFPYCFSTSAMSLLYECINTVIAGQLVFYMFICIVVSVLWPYLT